jgi:hypothetical protein
MEESMLNINLLYLYPETIEINNEMNLLRIVDREQKESLVFYYVRENEIYKIYMINTFTGENTYLISYEGKNNINKFIHTINNVDMDLKSLNNLNDIEKYILKSI